VDGLSAKAFTNFKNVSPMAIEWHNIGNKTLTKHFFCIFNLSFS
jgi:hypothetical protein